MSDDVCFPEPLEDDPSPGRPGEPRWAWLERSTWDRARETRTFYNDNLARLPGPIARQLCRELRRDASESRHFELVVGRFLQELGADLTYEAPGTQGHRVDWLAQFPGGTVSVEATAPVVNARIGVETRAAQPAAEMIARELPTGWTVWAMQVPRFHPNEPKRQFRRWLQEVTAGLPKGRPGDRISLDLEWRDSPVQLMLFGGDDSERPSEVGAGPAVGYVDNSSEVIHQAVAGKRFQARGAPKPVLAAIYTAGFGSHEVTKFDIGLFGRTVEHHGTGEITFDPSGAFGRGKGEPTFAGALAFVNLGMRGGEDPILYVHPRFEGDLPDEIRTLRRRELTREGIRDVPAARVGTLQRLGWPVS